MRRSERSPLPRDAADRRCRRVRAPARRRAAPRATSRRCCCGFEGRRAHARQAGEGAAHPGQAKGAALMRRGGRRGRPRRARHPAAARTGPMLDPVRHWRGRCANASRTALSAAAACVRGTTPCRPPRPGPTISCSASRTRTAAPAFDAVVERAPGGPRSSRPPASPLRRRSTTCRPCRAGAEFVAIGDAVWDHPDGPAAAIRAALAALPTPAEAR